MSKYKAAASRRNYNNDPGFNYRGKILLRHTDPSIWNNPTSRGVGIHIERILNELWFQIKMIKKSINYLVDIDDDNIH
jgi:hypothetical protein